MTSSFVTLKRQTDSFIPICEFQIYTRYQYSRLFASLPYLVPCPLPPATLFGLLHISLLSFSLNFYRPQNAWFHGQNIDHSCIHSYWLYLAPSWSRDQYQRLVTIGINRVWWCAGNSLDQLERIESSYLVSFVALAQLPSPLPQQSLSSCLPRAHEIIGEGESRIGTWKETKLVQQ